MKAFALAVLATLVVAGCAVAPKAERYVAPPIGSQWVTARTDAGSYGSGTIQIASTMGERSRDGKRYIAFESSQGTVLAHPNGDWQMMLAGDKPVMSWDPALSWDWPLEVGKRWVRSYNVTLHGINRTIPFETTQTVEAYEDVTVPAGTFSAFRIASRDSIGNDNVAWFSPELGLFVKQRLRRTAAHAQGPGTRDTDLVSHTIKR